MSDPDAKPALVRTVLGDRPATELGCVDYHEHLFQVSPLLPGDELDDEAASGNEAVSLKQAGIDAMIEATPTGLGRNPAAVARISQHANLTVMHTSGAHRQEHYKPDHWLLHCTTDELKSRFESDIRDGLPALDQMARGDVATGPTGAAVKAGLLKAGVGYWRISAFEHRVLEATGAVASTQGVAVMVHLEHGSAAWEVLEALRLAGLPASRVILAHIDRNLDPGLHAELTMAGAYIGYDGMARHREAPDSAIVECLTQVATTGDVSRIVLGGDVARRSRYLAYGGMPGLKYLPQRFLPRAREQLGDDVVDAFLRDNPARALTLRTHT